jgi:MoaA/NifB/PqqE/SkfB family radical SAM enzyme
MSLVELSINKLEKQKEAISMRARIDTGPFCNYNCHFCYYKESLGRRDSFDKFKTQIDIAERYGMTAVEFSGGESSVEPNWFRYLEYSKGKFEHMSCLSHGGKFDDMEFLRRSHALGLNEILFSLHGYDAESHELITGRKGSFKKILKAIENAQVLGLRVRLNCTVCNENYSQLHTKYAELVRSINPYQTNLIVLNYFNMGHLKEENKINYRIVAPFIHKFIEGIKDSVRYVSVRYIPFCYMVGYEEYVTDYFQLIYTLEDWNMAFFSHSDCPLSGETKEERLQEAWFTASQHRTHDYKKPLECLKCRYFYICDGMEKRSSDPVFPVEGEKIVDPLHYLRPLLVRDPY